LSFTFTSYHPLVLEDLNKKAKKAGLHVAVAKKADLYSIRKVKNGKLIAKNIDTDEVLQIIKKYK
jgi:ribosomal protein L4